MNNKPIIEFVKFVILDWEFFLGPPGPLAYLNN